MEAPDNLCGLSPSSQRAVHVARASALVRGHAGRDMRSRAVSIGSPASVEGGIPVTAGDLMVGVTLTHPDENGEARVLLEHFGLTARDVLPEDYPRLTFEELARRAAEVDLDSQPEFESDSISVLEHARRLGHSAVELRHLLGALLPVPQTLRWAQALNARGTRVDAVVESYEQWLRGGLASGEVAGVSLRRWLESRNPRRPVALPEYAPDSVDADRDLIGIEAEANAFAYLMASVGFGLFGDWGGDKSLLMRSIDRRLTTIQGLVRGQSPLWFTALGLTNRGST
jgi:hypothetical protein